MYNESISEEVEKLKTTTTNLINYNTNLPVAINKCFKIMKNDIDDMQDHLDRIDDDIDKKITSKQEVNKIKTRVMKLEENANAYKEKLLYLEDKIIGLERDMMYLKNKEPEKNEKKKPDIKDKKLKSDIRNTNYSIKQLTRKMVDGTITEKEKIRLEDKKILLDTLIQKTNAI